MLEIVQVSETTKYEVTTTRGLTLGEFDTLTTNEDDLLQVLRSKPVDQTRREELLKKTRRDQVRILTALIKTIRLIDDDATAVEIKNVEDIEGRSDHSGVTESTLDPKSILTIAKFVKYPELDDTHNSFLFRVGQEQNSLSLAKGNTGRLYPWMIRSRIMEEIGWTAQEIEQTPLRDITLIVIRFRANFKVQPIKGGQR